MKIVIIGQGAIGLLWYRYLSLSNNNNVQLICSKNITRPPKRFTFTSLDNKSEQIDLVTASQESIKSADLILLCVKAFQVVDAIDSVKCTINQSAVIALCHNGMGVAEKLPQRIIKKHNILSMLITHGAKANASFNITHTGNGKTDIGSVYGKLNNHTKERILKTLNNALPNVYWQHSVKQQQWEKLAINCVINPITAINNIKNGQVNNIEYKQEISETIAELVTIAQMEGVNLTSESLITTVKKVASLTAENTSSMLSDILAARKTEIDNINGYIHQLGIHHKIATPQNTFFWQQVNSLEKRK
ncbi:ketopantoate reductase family protein [Thalassotalea piscium]|uniref:2-dehydropantoate 2-reductase n=1 Tax=Thalassotalea piscium TaxID=1230533 RepID=A0A7X0NE82_9GAMM|nr:2-dehydropantoate 2-reductase [Thalassotalea piscium]MBB6541807.1 2-dehydropantoate 2-reductase [Thalassotalea piscium]